MWTKVDSRFPRHPKVITAATLRLGPHGHARVSNLWLEGACYANENLTDGFVPVSEVKRFHDPKPLEVAAALVQVGLWQVHEGGFLMHDYGDWNPVAAEVKDKLAKHRERQRRYRSIQGVTRQEPQHETQHETRHETEHVMRDVTQLSQGDRARDPVPSRPDTVPKEIPVHTASLTSETSARPENPPPRCDEDFATFSEAFPESRRQGDYLTQQAYIAACGEVSPATLLEAVGQHKRSEQWQRGIIPSERTWLMEKHWRRVLPEPSTGPDAQAREREKARHCLEEINLRNAAARASA